MINKNKIITWLISVLFILPYFETGPFYHIFSDADYNYCLRTILILQVLIASFLLVRNFKCRISGSRKSVFIFLLYIFINGLFSAIVREHVLAVVISILTLSLPVIIATLIEDEIDRYELDINTIIKNCINIYSLFIVFTVFFNVYNYGLALSVLNNTVRLSASAGGPVILGYTISLVLMFTFVSKDVFSRTNYTIVCFIMIGGIVYTMDRGAYLIMLLGFLYLAIKERNKLHTALFIAAILLVVLFNSHNILSKLLPVLFNRENMSNLQNEGRFTMAVKFLSLFIREPNYLLFGHGLDNFFPLQTLTAKNSFATVKYIYFHPNLNSFIYKGVRYAGQPHNTFVYLLMEAGVVGVVAYLSVVFYGIRDKYRKIIPNVLTISLAILLLSMMESTIFVQPGVACTWWLIMNLNRKKSLENR